MSKPFRFRYVNELAGVFVIAVALALIVGVILAGRSQGWFIPEHAIYTQFPAEGTAGLQEGSEVHILGTRVGSVKEITVAADDRMEAVLTVKGDFVRFVRDDSQVVAKKKLGGAGDVYIEITQGRGAPLEQGAYLPFVKGADIFDQVQGVIASVQAAIEEYTGLASDLRNPEGNLQQLIQHLDGIVAGIEAGEGAAGKILRDPQVAEDVAAIVAGIKVAVENLQAILDDVRQETSTMTGVIGQTQEAIDEATQLIEGLQKHWLIRKYVEQGEEGQPLISPLDVRQGRDD